MEQDQSKTETPAVPQVKSKPCPRCWVANALENKQCPLCGFSWENKAHIVRLCVADKPTTGSKWADRMDDQAVDSALLRLKPIIRDELRKELKRFLEIEEVDE